MQFTGRNLQLVADALRGAMDEVQGQIGCYPDVFEFAEDVEALENLKEEYGKLLYRVLRKIG